MNNTDTREPDSGNTLLKAAEAYNKEPFNSDAATDFFGALYQTWLRKLGRAVSIVQSPLTSAEIKAAQEHHERWVPMYIPVDLASSASLPLLYQMFVKTRFEVVSNQD